ncbi:MAG TPA: RNA 3'-terminal phosphate cyclase [Geobacteraceae bacterium]|nr:RNA 3'-terminal phosphate cyclase [Geobacteraceae bacterium]
MLVIDGSRGEGGGQILRTSLALSLVTGRPFRIEKIRAGRKKPGLMRQHLTAVEAAATVGRAELEEAAIGSQCLIFAPEAVKAGKYRFAMGTAGSCTLVLQTILPALMTADGPSEVVLEGGTHNPHAPPFDFLARAFLPLIGRMGPKLSAHLERPGFYPAGGGKFTVAVEPAAFLHRLDLSERGLVLNRAARAVLARLPRHIGERELAVVRARLGWNEACCRVEEVTSPGPGNIICLEIESEHCTEVFTGFGERGVSAEKVAEEAVRQVEEYLAADVPVGPHLADQLLLPMALAGGGSFRTMAPTAHLTTNAEVIRKFLPVDVQIRQLARNDWEVIIEKRM